MVNARRPIRGQRYFGQRYFGQHYFGQRYFGQHYFGQHYFGQHHLGINDDCDDDAGLACHSIFGTRLQSMTAFQLWQ